MKVSIVIPWYNTEWLVKKNLPAVLAAAGNSKNNVLEVIIVDDGSSDASASIIKENFPEIKLIRHKVNRGFPASVNTGVRASSGNLICQMNSDVIPEADFLKPVFDYFEDPKIFGVAFNDVGDYNRVDCRFKGGFFDYLPIAKTRTSSKTLLIKGSNGVFRKKIWFELGGMDENLFSPFCWADADLCYRAAKRDRHVVWEPGARIKHHHDGSIHNMASGFVQKIYERNQLLFAWKNLTSTRLTRKHISGIIKRIMVNPGYLRIVMSALGKIGMVLRSRTKEMKEAKVSDEAIFERFSDA